MYWILPRRWRSYLILGPCSAWTPVDITEVNLFCAGLPAAMDGLRLAFLSDLHMGRWVGEAYVRRVLDLACSLKPHAILLGGDMVERSGTISLRFGQLIGEYCRRYPVYATMGNHEYYSSHQETVLTWRRAGVDLLINRHRLIGPDGRPAEGGPSIALAGIDDLSLGRPDFEAALAGIPADTFTLLLGHNPDLADLPSARGSLMLSGHTHGGQIRLLGRAVITQTRNRRYASGLIQGPAFGLYVSRGLGVAGLPIRLGCPPELPLIVLHAGSNAR